LAVEFGSTPDPTRKETISDRGSAKADWRAISLAKIETSCVRQIR
jgi:hypothetical protein